MKFKVSYLSLVGTWMGFGFYFDSFAAKINQYADSLN